jgi:hypothetical protein
LFSGQIQEQSCSESLGMWNLIRNEKKRLFSLIRLPFYSDFRGHRMCKEMTVIPVDRVVDKKRIIGKNGTTAECRTTECWML